MRTYEKSCYDQHGIKSTKLSTKNNLRSIISNLEDVLRMEKRDIDEAEEIEKILRQINL